MTRTLRDLINEWEKQNLVSVGTIARVKSGLQVKHATAVQIAIALGADPEEARALAETQAPSDEESEAKAQVG